MHKETLNQARHRYATVDADIRIERMMTEIVLNGTKETSLVVNSAQDEALWDGLAAQIAEIKAKGGTVIYGWPYWED